jgi:DNA repair exonuclease SbcCD nuclease subunit
MIDISNVKRIWFISDTHLGIKNNSKEWLENMDDYFTHFFLPLLRERKRPGDMLWHMGDFFDNRTSIGLPALNLGMRVAEEIASLMPMFILVGNHDIFNTQSNDINSLKPLKKIDHVYVFEEPEIVKIKDTSFLMMPWRTGPEAELECIRKYDTDYLCCHTDIQGLRFNKGSVVEHGITLDDLKKYKRIFAGHIHKRQNVGNVMMLGSPYPMDRSGIGESYTVYCWDIETDEWTLYENKRSPKFVRTSMDMLVNMKVSDIRDLVRNNYVDVMVSSKWFEAPQLFSTFTEMFTEARRIHMESELVTDEDIPELSDGEKNFNIEDALKVALQRHVEALGLDETAYTKLEAGIMSVYKKIVDKEQEVPE